MEQTISECVRELRNNMTEPEKIFWEKIRKRQIGGKRFLRQHPIIFEYEDQKRFFVADFYCREAQLIIEIDGKIHDVQKDQDLLRTEVLNHLGLKVLRFKNDEILKNLESVIDRLLKYLP